MRSDKVKCKYIWKEVVTNLKTEPDEHMGRECRFLTAHYNEVPLYTPYVLNGVWGDESLKVCGKH
jgi:hypothetical protein